MPLPDHYLITPNPDDEAQFLAALGQSLLAGTRLMLFKARGLDDTAYRALASQVIALAHDYDCQVLLATDAAMVMELGADGLHLDSKALTSCTQRPLPNYMLLAVSGHNLEELLRGEELGADFAVLSPINYTSAHPDITPLGWDGMKQIVTQLRIPVYALGGVSAEDAAAAKAAGGKGIAGNKGYWRS